MQKDIENYIEQIKKLMARIDVLENNENNSKDDSLEETSLIDDNITEKRNHNKNRNKITISVSDAQNYNIINNNNNLNEADFKKRKFKKVTKIDLNNRKTELFSDNYEDFETNRQLVQQVGGRKIGDEKCVNHPFRDQQENICVDFEKAYFYKFLPVHVIKK